MADTTSPPINKCETCEQPAAPGQPLNPCGRCNNVFYCSRLCQAADWVNHRNVCFNRAQPSAASNANPAPQTQPSAPAQTAPPPARPALTARVNNPFKRLSLHRWLHGRPEIDVYTLLIDTYRLRVYDDLFNKLEINEDSFYSQGDDGGEWGFRNFLQRVGRHRAGLLPGWWSPIKTEECVQLGLSGDEWSSLGRTVNKDDIVDHYKDWMIPMQLRIFGESIYTGGNAMKGKSLKEQLEFDNKEQSQ